MSSAPNNKERTQQAKPDAKGRPTFSWTLSDTSLNDTVKLVLPPTKSLPIIFVPGIMGSNLIGADGKPVWRLNSTKGQPVGLAWKWVFESAGSRQRALHPARTKVDRDGAVPKTPVGTIHSTADFTERGWGEVGETSYHEFLLWLEEKMNGGSFNPAKWEDFYYTSVSATPKPGEVPPEPKLLPGITMVMHGLPAVAEGRHYTKPILSDDLLARSKWRFPVYACGYNWLDDNLAAADRLATRIGQVIAENNRGSFHCEQVILVTHSMGGLVARACSEINGMREKIAGIVHGVMPATGAAVAYRRCKIGMRDEDFGASLVIGQTGREVAAVFAQAPGALQLLPSQDYQAGWLQVKDASGKKVESLPLKDPYEEIYLRKDKWWGVVKEEWLRPEKGQPISWNEFANNINLAKQFHQNLSAKYHSNTFVFYGAGDGGQASFETIRWAMKRGIPPDNGTSPSATAVTNYTHAQVREGGANPIYVGGATEIETVYVPGLMNSVNTSYETSFWEIHCEKQDGKGDGTVPVSSGKAPRTAASSNIRQQFALTGFSHEPAYKNATAQCVTHYAITKIVNQAKAIA